MNYEPSIHYRNTEPEFSFDTFESELLDGQDNDYKVEVKCESYINDGEIRIVRLVISGNICEYTFNDVLEIISQRNQNKQTRMECKPTMRTINL